MAISIDYSVYPHVILIPKADSTLVQASPEIREYDVDAFRLELKSLEDDETGIAFPDTHSHNTLVVISGLTLARVVEITDDYVVEFEDGQYTVKLIGANHNLADVAIENQVRLITQLSAGLIDVSSGMGQVG